jgi:ATP-dependent Lon protease
VLAAYRYGTKIVLFPKDNERDLSEIPDDIKKAMTFHLVDNMDEVLDIALSGPIPGLTLSEPARSATAETGPADGSVTH